MERLRTRAFIVAGIFIAMASILALTPKATFAKAKTEPQLEQMAPRRVDKFEIAREYKMEDSTYATLAPYGIVSRIFQNGPQVFDVVLIASNKKSSFHDPRVCFRAQQWEFLDERQETLDTSRGPIPMTVVNIESKEKVRSIAAFFYKGPSGFRSTPQSLAWTMLLQQLVGNTEIEGVFYRFMPMYDGATEAELKDFIRLYMSEAKETSKGFF